jgi:hypothetical protein
MRRDEELHPSDLRRFCDNVLRNKPREKSSMFDVLTCEPRVVADRADCNIRVIQRALFPSQY